MELLLTGDHEGAARRVAREVGIERVFARVLPDQKAERVAALQAEGRRVMMVGDGVNDAPALARADVGVAMGGGTDVAMETADLTLMGSSLRGVGDAVELSRASVRNVRQNLVEACRTLARPAPPGQPGRQQVDRLQVDLKKKKDQLDSLKEQLEKKASVMKEAEAREMQKDYEKRLRDFERSYKDSQGELQQKDNELTVELLKELQGVIEEFGKEGGYSIILEQSSSSVLYGSPELDVTEQIIARYNARR